ncbi:MAG: GMC family oxidoreductase N-terminal domain-containing protein [Elainella sp. Prado103]|jgi:choline dehydrogenase|nr:GMC family oxidoreductase N-terminal domain-containing protein [Elainella sp. Prado103]
MDAKKAFDYIIVGAGSTGCVLANRLSADRSINVLLLEAGGPDSNSNIHKINTVVDLWGTEIDWQFWTEPQPALNGRRINLIQGKVLGGGSSIHAMMYMRGNPRNFDVWNALGNEGWSYRDVLPYFKKSEDYEGGGDEFHGVGGPMQVRKPQRLSPVAVAFLNAAMELGYAGSDWDFNGAWQEDGAGLVQFNITRDNRRCSSATAFLTPILDRPNLTVQTHAMVTRLLMEAERVVGVEYLQDGQIHHVRADQEVILSAGTILSPKLLMLSGIGAAETLQSLGLPVVVDLPGVGQNLQDHLRLQVIYQSKQEMPTLEVLAEVALFTRTRNDMQAAPPDLQINFSAGLPQLAPPEFNATNPVSIFVPVLVQPQSRGEVRLRSANPTDPPIIDPRYLQMPTDLETYVRAIELCRQIANTKAFTEFNNGEVAPGLNSNLERYVRTYADTIWHPVGTCKMGRDPMAVVDPSLRVHGVEGLRVADASIMPTIPSGNTNASCVMIGEKAADLVLQSSRTAMVLSV